MKKILFLIILNIVVCGLAKSQIYNVPRNSNTIFIKSDSVSVQQIKNKLILLGYTIENETPTNIKTNMNWQYKEIYKTQIVADLLRLDSGEYWAFKILIDNSYMANAYSSAFSGISTSGQTFIYNSIAKSPTSKTGKVFGSLMKLVFTLNPQMTFSIADSKGWWKYDISKF
jgi:hypothetical protein